MTGSFQYARPQIPSGLLHTVYEISQEGKHLSQESGGQWIPGEEVKIPFQGCILPANDKDLIRAEGGTYENVTQKIYTNNHKLAVGEKIYDPQEGEYYTVSHELGHNSIHPMTWYLLERKGKAGQK